MVRTICALALAISTTAVAMPSVWDDAKHESNQNKFVGKIESIANDGNEMIIHMANSKGSEVFRVCSSYPGGDANNLSEADRVRSLREAFDKGYVVAASFNSPFERCLSYVEVRKDDKDEAIKEAVKVTQHDSKSQKSDPVKGSSQARTQ